MLETALGSIPPPFGDHIKKTFISLKQHLAAGRLDSAGLAAGKFCEATLRLLQDRATGSHTKFGKKIGNFADECRKIITAPNNKVITESEKLLVPRALVFLYTMRNTRGIGHVGGDIDPNNIDLATMGGLSDWILCELIRVYHKMPLEDAQAIIDKLAKRVIPDVWQVASTKRVLRDGLKVKDKVLMLLFASEETEVYSDDLFHWTEYSNKSVFQSKVLAELHRDRLIEWDKEDDWIVLSPKGAEYVEEKILSDGGGRP